MKQELNGMRALVGMTASELVTRVLARHQATHKVQVVYSLLHHYARTKKQLPSNADFAADADLSIGWLQKSLAVLKKLGVIAIQFEPHRMVYIPEIIETSVVRLLDEVYQGRVTVDVKTGTVKHEECGLPVDLSSVPPLAPERYPLALRRYPPSAPARRDSEQTRATQLDLTDAIGSTYVQVNDVEAASEKNLFRVCSCFLVMGKKTGNNRNDIPDITGMQSGNEETRGRKAAPVEIEVVEVFEYWKSTCNWPHQKLNAQVASAIRSRLRDFSVAELKQVADYGASNEWLNGTSAKSTRRYNGWKTLFLYASNTAEYVQLVKAGPAVGDRRHIEHSFSKPLKEVDQF